MDVLKDKIAAKTLADMGYVKIPFLDQSEIDRLNRFYEENPPSMKDAFHSTPLSTDMAYRRAVNQIIRQTFGRALKANFSANFNFFFGAFTVKEPSSPNSEWDIHQDWTFIDEKRFPSVGVWVPLLDVNRENGCLSVVDRSHRFIENIRGTNTFSEYSKISDTIKKDYLTEVPMKAGEAAIFMNSLLHYSPPNFSAEPRISVNCLMFPENAQPVHHYRNEAWPQNEVEKFEISSETMVTHNFRDAERPKTGKTLGMMKINTNSLSMEQFEQLYTRYNGNLLQRSLGILREKFS